jgi:hypothetical protein
MKKTLLSFFFGAAFVVSSVAQITVPGPIPFNDITGGTVSPIFQGTAGTVPDVPVISGSLTSVGVDAILTASTGDTYANDLMILVTATGDITDATGYLLQVGGFGNFVPANKHAWGCEPACDTDAANTAVTGTVSAFAAMNFTGSTMVIWLANGYVNANPPTNTGSWTINSISFGGVTLGVGLEENTISSKVYPNPAENTLNVEISEELSSVNVISLDGKIVVSQVMNGSTSVDVANLNSGAYVLEATTVSGAVVRTNFIKK